MRRERPVSDERFLRRSLEEMTWAGGVGLSKLRVPWEPLSSRPEQVRLTPKGTCLSQENSV
jgi:hypothetical protein